MHLHEGKKRKALFYFLWSLIHSKAVKAIVKEIQGKNTKSASLFNVTPV